MEQNKRASRGLAPLAGALLIVLVAAGLAAAEPARPGSTLVLVSIHTPGDVDRVTAVGWPIYAQWQGEARAYLLTGSPDASPEALDALHLPYRVVDAETPGSSYYLAYPAPGRPAPDWLAFGQPLFADARAALLRIDPADALRLAETGVQLDRVTLTPKPRAAAAPAAFPPVTAPDPIVQSMIDQVDTDTIYAYTGDLSGEWAAIVGGAPYTITTRYTNSGTPVENATEYAGDHLRQLNLTVEEHRWASGKPPNVIGELSGETNPGDIFMITAHLDDMPSGSIAPGADDNASGSVAVLVAADILTQYRWGCTLRFALWTGEEQGLLGSDKYAQRAAQRGENILGVLNLDMIAWNTAGSSPDIDVHANGAMPATVELAEQFASVVNIYALDLVPEVRSDGTGASDHASFWEYGYTAILGIEDYYPSNHDFNPRYHTTGDRLQYLDMMYFTEYVKAAVASVAHMSDCLLTGTLQGTVTAAHDGSPIAGASLSMREAHALTYATIADDAGHYGRPVPAATYDVSASAYGYLPATTGDVSVPPGSTVEQDFVLVAAPPAAPTVAIGQSESGVSLTWSHVAPDTAYQVHRAGSPYFAPDPASLQTTLPMPFAEPVGYLDSSGGTGDPQANHFYLVLGMNPAGEGAASNRVGEFDFELNKGG